MARAEDLVDDAGIDVAEVLDLIEQTIQDNVPSDASDVGDGEFAVTDTKQVKNNAGGRDLILTLEKEVVTTKKFEVTLSLRPLPDGV